MATKPKGSAFDKIAEEVKDRPEILPKLEFGDKTHEGVWTVEFTEPEPREFTYEDKFNGGEEAVGFAVNVIHLPDGGQPEPRSVVMRADPNHGLTAGIAKLKSKHGTLMGVRAQIRTRIYTHKTYGPTKGFDVFEVVAGMSEQPSRPESDLP